MDFEQISLKAKLPDDWIQWGSGYDHKIDKTVKKSRNASLLIESPPEKQANTFASVAYRIPGNYAGREIELRSFLKLEDIPNGFAGLCSG